ncbi:unnamed protein product, partial [Phaeothamnion confervicola]
LGSFTRKIWNGCPFQNREEAAVILALQNAGNAPRWARRLQLLFAVIARGKAAAESTLGFVRRNEHPAAALVPARRQLLPHWSPWPSQPATSGSWGGVSPSYLTD